MFESFIVVIVTYYTNLPFTYLVTYLLTYLLIYLLTYKLVGLVWASEGQRPLGAALHSPDEPGELSQWLCQHHKHLIIIIIIIIIIILPSVV